MTLLIFCLPEGVERFNKRSGTPEILDVKAIVPFANAANGRPEGASVTERVSTKSTYSSLEVCRTLALRQGNAGVFVANDPVEDIADMFEVEVPDENPGFLGFYVRNISDSPCDGIHTLVCLCLQEVFQSSLQLLPGLVEHLVP